MILRKFSVIEGCVLDCEGVSWDLDFVSHKQICKLNTKLTKFEKQAANPSLGQAWFNTSWSVGRANPTHKAQKLSRKTTEVDDGDVEV